MGVLELGTGSKSYSREAVALVGRPLWDVPHGAGQFPAREPEEQQRDAHTLLPGLPNPDPSGQTLLPDGAG